MTRFWKHIQYLSLDVVTGAIVSSLFVAKILDVQIGAAELTGLGIAIWLIYTTDHLLDAKAINGMASNPRHAFHQKYFKAILVIAGIVFALGLWNISFLRVETIKFGGVLIFCVGIYFLTIRMVERKSLLHKEISAALIYCFGVFAGPLSLIYDVSISTAILFLQFFIIVLLNLLIFPLYEIESDREDKMNSLAISIGQKRVNRMINLLFGASLCLAVFALLPLGFVPWENDWILSQIVLLIMMFILLSLVIWPQFFQYNGLYRTLGDGVFLIPALALI